MKTKTVSVLAVAAISIGLGFAASSGATAAPAMGEMQASTYASGEVLGGGFVPPQPARKAAHHSRGLAKQPPKIRLNPIVCYERRRVGPQQYVIVRRAC